MLEVGTKQSLLCGVSRVVSIPFCMALLNLCCTQNFGFWQLRRISPTRCAPRRLGGGGGVAVLLLRVLLMLRVLAKLLALMHVLHVRAWVCCGCCCG